MNKLSFYALHHAFPPKQENIKSRTKKIPVLTGFFVTRHQDGTILVLLIANLLILFSVISDVMNSFSTTKKHLSRISSKKVPFGIDEYSFATCQDLSVLVKKSGLITTLL
jgi:hypothetical protein